MLTIDDHFFNILVFGLQQTIKQKLDCIQRLAVTPDQAAAFLGINLQLQVSAFTRGFLDLHNETEITEHRIEQFFRGHHRFRFPAGATFSSFGMG